MPAIFLSLMEGIIGQVWRGARPPLRVAVSALPGLDIRPIDEELGRSAGELLARIRKRDVVDAALVLLANDGDTIVTSDANDLRVLARGTGHSIDLIEV